MADKFLSADLPIAPAVSEGPAKKFDVFRETVAGMPDLDGVLKGRSDIRFPERPSLRNAVVIGLISRAKDSASPRPLFALLICGYSFHRLRVFAHPLYR